MFKKTFLFVIAAVMMVTSAFAYAPLPIMEQYIRQEAKKRGINPETAVRVARSEGCNPTGESLKFVVPEATGGVSVGPFQLYMGGGLGNVFKRKYGRAPCAGNWREQVAFSLDYASRNGWSAWHGAGRVGIHNWTGIRRRPGGWLHVQERHGVKGEKVTRPKFTVHSHPGGWKHIHRIPTKKRRR